MSQFAAFRPVHDLSAKLAVVLALFLSAAVTRAAEPFLGAQVQAKIDAAARAQIAAGSTAGAAIGVLRDGQLVFNRGYGLANVELRVPVTASTVFSLASLTKQFTAASVLLLVEQHKLSLDDTLAKFYPDFPRGKEVTIRNLLNHTSGISSYTKVNVESLDPGKQWDEAKFAARIAGLGFDFDPGTRWYYSNSGYYLLGQIIEIVSKKSFAQFLKDNLYDPLGMMDTAVDNETEVVPFRASGYSANKAAPSGFVNAPYISMSIVYAAGGMRSTVADLAKWNFALYGGKVLSADSLKIMTAPARLNNGKLASEATFYGADETPDAPIPGVGPAGYTMGLHTGSLDGHRFIGHDGSVFGFDNVVENFSDDRFVLIVLTNTDEAAPALEREIARILLPGTATAHK